MSYVITAEVHLDAHMNISGDISKVKARFFYRNDNSIVFDVNGSFDSKTQKEIVLKLCRDMVDAGFLDFSIRHSF
ncbi:hypothetical protein [Methylophilus sp. 3sh_L]|uniref:hypothetical protein n=1 Tax=Methylophilus sp. 3sh_L TaxID=3377114 RepID=UPI00398E7D92